ncbi:MAG: MurR/RpiR family transcriptional regulator [Chloroflexi bacterium]|nr:MurR/RpiR family transcriptional regulator [Chloroflexota bacterium]
MSTTFALEKRIAEHFDDLTPKQQALARLILDNRYLASVASAAELGALVDASAATVVRLAQALGYKGLPDLQEALREELPKYLTAVERLERRLTIASASDDVARRVFELDVRNLNRTELALSDETFEAAVEALSNAGEILVLGSGVSASTALFLGHSLQVIGCRAHAAMSEDITLAVNLAHLSSDDVVVVISVWRYVRSMVSAIEIAKSHGATTIAVTDSIVSPLTRHADYAFEVATEGLAHGQSMTAIMSLLNALVAGVSLRNPKRTHAALKRVEAELKAADLLLE